MWGEMGGDEFGWDGMGSLIWWDMMGWWDLDTGSGLGCWDGADGLLGFRTSVWWTQHELLQSIHCQDLGVFSPGLLGFSQGLGSRTE